jgi:hypothetical protein
MKASKTFFLLLPMEPGKQLYSKQKSKNCKRKVKNNVTVVEIEIYLRIYIFEGA